MLGQTAESKIEKFVDTMPTIIQTHLFTCENWEKTTKKAKELEHIIRKCDPLAAALPNLTQGTAVPNPLQYRYKRNTILMKILIITTTMRITEVNPEAIDLIEANVLDDFSDVKILVVEANIPKTHTKVNIKVTIIKVITARQLRSIQHHIEAINR